MDVKLPPKKWYVKYRIHIVAGILAAGLIVMLIKVSTGPKIIRINSDSVQTADRNRPERRVLGVRECRRYPPAHPDHQGLYP